MKFLPPTPAGDYSCRDGEISISKGFALIPVMDQPGDYLTGETIEGTYTVNLPPIPVAEFRLKRDILPGYQNHPDNYPSMTMAVSSEDPAFKTTVLNNVLFFIGRGSRHNLFSRPFFALAAWRLRDGNRLCPTPPVLMTPNSGMPEVTATPLSATSTQMSLQWHFCSLQCRLTIPPSLEAWRNEVEALEILVSKPLAPYLTEPLFSVSSPPTWKFEPLVGYSQQKQILSLTDFYTVSEIFAEELRSDTDFRPVEFNCGNLTDCRASTPFVPQYIQLSKIESVNAMRTIRGGIILNDVTTTPPEPLSPQYCTEQTDDNLPPQWIFHPDPDAREYRYQNSSGVWMALPLRRHPSLYGSYYFNPYDNPGFEGKAVPSGNPSPTSKQLAGSILSSLPGQPLVFTDEFLLTSDLLFSEKSTKSSSLLIRGTGEEGILVTRPIKLSDGESFKRVKRITLRGIFDPSLTDMEVEGSRELNRWFRLARGFSTATVSVGRHPIRFLRVTIRGRLSPHEYLESLSFTVVSPPKIL